MSFDEFLKKIDLDFETYKLAICSSLKQEKVFLERQPNETRIIPYSPTLLKCWLANMDIQFILDPYACATYIVSYISKGQRGMSNLLHKACEEAKRCDSDMCQQVRRIGNQFLTHVEVGAQGGSVSCPTDAIEENFKVCFVCEYKSTRRACNNVEIETFS